jgi:hypothetical protein
MENLLRGPPKIPKGIDEVLYYKLSSKKYFDTLKTLVWIFIQIMATLLILGIIWITIEWVKLVVTAIAIIMALILFLFLIFIF